MLNMLLITLCQVEELLFFSFLRLLKLMLQIYKTLGTKQVFLA
jgi:hypothetical protein